MLSDETIAYLRYWPAADAATWDETESATIRKIFTKECRVQGVDIAEFTQDCTTIGNTAKKEICELFTELLDRIISESIPTISNVAIKPYKSSTDWVITRRFTTKNKGPQWPFFELGLTLDFSQCVPRIIPWIWLHYAGQRAKAYTSLKWILPHKNAHPFSSNAFYLDEIPLNTMSWTDDSEEAIQQRITKAFNIVGKSRWREILHIAFRDAR